jgi:hypothetical protein
MLNQFIKALRLGVGYIKAEYLILGALGVATFILLVGFIMTLATARGLAREGTPFITLRRRSRRNLIFIVAFAYVIIATVAIYTLFPGEVLLYLTIPALVLLLAFIMEALFECIDDRNRKRVGIRICHCECGCSGCTAEGATQETITTKQSKKREEVEEAEEIEEKQKIVKPAIKKTTEKEEETKAAESQQVLRRAQQLEQEREQLAQEREELMQASHSEEEELRRQKFENERRQLAILARQTSAAQFGETATETAKKPVPKPITVSTTSVVKPVVKPASAETLDGVSTYAQRSSTFAAKSDDAATTEYTETETVTQTTTTKFDSLQAKLELLRKGNATQASATKVEAKGKYDEGEVKSALSDLIKSMQARRTEE